MSRARESTREPNAELHRHWQYAIRDFGALEKQTAAERSPAAAYARYTALVELGRLDEATKLFPLQSEVVTNPFHFLNTAIAWRLAGNLTEAAHWQERAVALLALGDADMARAAGLFRKSTPPTQAELDAVAVPVEAKASILAALAQLHPARRTEFAAQARRLNVAWSFPHHLLARAAAETP